MKDRIPEHLPRPTDAELGILRVLWELGPSTVRQVHEALPDSATGYTTVLKFLQIMYEKGLVTRNDTQRAHVYQPALSKDAAEGMLLGDLARRVFDNSAERLVLRALGSGTAVSREELSRIRTFLDDLEKQQS